MPATRHQHGHGVSESRMAPSSLDLADAVVEGVLAGFGALSVGIEVVVRTLGESPARVPRRPGPRMPASEVADVLVGTAWGAARLSGRLAATGARITAPLLGLVLRPPLLPRRLQPAHRVQLMTERWQHDRPEALRTLGRWSAAALPGAMDAALDRVDVGEVFTGVLDRVDLTGIATTLLERLDLDAVAAQLLDQLRLDAVVTQVLDQLRLDAVVGQVLDQVRVDELATQVLDQLDLTQLVLDRVDLQRVVAGALDRLDLTAIVVEQVDLGDVVAVALQHVDLTQIVMSQVDLLGVAQYVVDGIDLPEIIRDSTGSVASEAVVGLRMQGIDADVLVGRVVDKMLRRRRERRTEGPLEQPGSSASAGDLPAGNAE